MQDDELQHLRQRKDQMFRDDHHSPIPAGQRSSRGRLIVKAAFSLPATRENLEGLLAADRVHLVAVGRAFIANPDLVQRLQVDAPLNAADESSFYGGTDAGYIDYPAPDELAA